MKIAIASGKGGTGKTFVATNLFGVMPQCALADLDVEAANAHLFLKPGNMTLRRATVSVPQIDADKCTACGECARACRYNALAALGKAGVMVFRELCHSCRVCEAVCEAGAIGMAPHEIGQVRRGACDGQPFADGELDLGQVRTTSLISQVKSEIAAPPLQLWDCPPGTSCAAREAVEGADLCLLVTEATPFGLHDLALAIELLGYVGIPCAVVINRDGLGREDVGHFCDERNVPVAARIPFSRSVAQWYSAGRLAVDEDSSYRCLFGRLAEDLLGGKFSSQRARRPLLKRRVDPQGGTGGHLQAFPVAGSATGADGLCRMVVISGKGGTGKTTLVGSLAAVSERVALADCDVDAANLHLIVSPQEVVSEEFQSGFLAEIDPDRCAGCGVCAERCQFDAIRMTPKATVDVLKCEGCGLCQVVCPIAVAGDPDPVTMVPALSGEILQARSRYGPFTSGRLWAGGEASGKLVAAVRAGADAAAGEMAVDRVLMDGPPGTGCAVNASITGADFGVVVTEPTQSGLHDMRRALDLLALFKVPAAVVVNKADVNLEVAETIISQCAERGVEVLGQVPFDRAISDILAQGEPAVSVPDSPAALALREICDRIICIMQSQLEGEENPGVSEQTRAVDKGQ